jgi:hypothetical protein
MGIVSRLAHAWNAITSEEDKILRRQPLPVNGGHLGMQMHRSRLSFSNDKNIVTSVINRIAIDVASIDIRHVIVDDDENYVDRKRSGLDNCLSLEANVDQNALAFKIDAVMQLLDKGTVALVPVDTDIDPEGTNGFQIETMRAGEIVAWYPRHVRVRIWDDREEVGGIHREVTLPKKRVAIIENPLYATMNEPNSTLQRLIRKLNLLDSVEDVAASGKLDLLIQLPYVVKSEARRQQAEQRIKDIEVQLQGSKYGVAYTDGQEKVVQLNRAVDNNLLASIEYLTKELYGQLGITVEVMNGTADEATMLNYWNRTIEPILTALTLETKRSFLSKTARTQGQSIKFFRDPFKLVPIAQVAEIADKFTRNEIVTANEFRGFIGLRPSKDPKANELRNSNVPQPVPGPVPEPVPEPTPTEAT